MAPSKKQIWYPAKMIESFFTEDAQKEPNIFKLSKVLVNQGITGTRLRQAMAIIIGIISSRLGDPVPMIITEDEGAGAIELLHDCLNLVPSDAWILEATDKASKYDNKNVFGKTVICNDADSSKNLLSKLLMEIELHAKIDKKGSQSQIQTLGSFIAFTKNPANPLLQNRYVTRVHINAGPEYKEKRLESLIKKSDFISQQRNKVECACARTLLKRVTSNPVDIDIADQLINPDSARHQNIIPFAESMFKILRIITRINNTPPLRQEELFAAFVDLTTEDLLLDETTRISEPLKATIIDYNYFLMIFKDFFTVNNEFLTPRQYAIYEAIISQNIEYQQKFSKHKKSTPQQMLNDYPDAGNNKGWATRDDIMARLSSYPEQFSLSTLHKEIKVLLEHNVIKGKKVPNKANQYHYVATRALTDSALFETDIKKIKDPNLKGKAAEIPSFLSGKGDRI